MNFSTGLVLAASILLATSGQLLLKTGMNRVGEVASVSASSLAGLVGNIFTTWQLALGLVCFGSSAVFWLVTLSRVPLSTAYPIVSMSYVIILTFSWLILGERPSPIVWLGALLIMGGVSLVGIGQR